MKTSTLIRALFFVLVVLLFAKNSPTALAVPNLASLQMPNGYWIPNRPQGLPRYFLSLPVDDPVTDGRVIQAMINTLDHAGNVFRAGGLNMIPAIRLIPGMTASNAFFTGLHSSLFIAYQNVDPTGVAKHPKFTVPIWVHEFGHSIFYQNYELVAPRAGRVVHAYNTRVERALDQAKLDDMTLGLIEINALKVMGQVTRLKRGNAPAQTIAAAQAEFDGMFAKYKALNAQEEQIVSTVISAPEKAEFDKIRAIESPMNEFFADVAAVLISEDPQAELASTYFACAAPASRKMSVARNFDVVRPDESWKATEAHLLYSPTRSWVWKYCLDGPRLRLLGQRGLKGYALRKVLEAIGSEIETRYTQNQTSISVPEANQRLQSAIDRYLLDPQTGAHLCHN